MVQKQIKEALKRKEKKRTEEMCAFKKMSISDSDQESLIADPVKKVKF